MEKIKQDHRIWAAIAYILFFIPLLIVEAKKSEFVKFHIRQGLGLFIIFVAARALTLVVMRALSPLAPIINVFLLFWLGFGIFNAVQGEKRPLPIIGGWAEKYLRI
jgi:uncharacterized membrane protein